MSWNTVRPGMSVFSKNTGPYRVISAARYSSFHTVFDYDIFDYEKLFNTGFRLNTGFAVHPLWCTF